MEMNKNRFFDFYKIHILKDYRSNTVLKINIYSFVLLVVNTIYVNRVIDSVYQNYTLMNTHEHWWHMFCANVFNL